MKIFNKPLPPKKIHWKDITIARHKAIMDVYRDYEIYEKDDELQLLYDLTTAVYGKPKDWLDKMKVKEANEWANTLAFINETPRVKVAKGEYTLNGHRYKVSMNMQEITTAQYIDFQQMADKADDMPAEFLSIILIPDGHKYNDGYDISKVVYDIENYMSVEDCLSLSAFFLSLLRLSMRRSLHSLVRMERKARKEGLMTEEQLDDLRKVRQLLESAGGMKRWMR